MLTSISKLSAKIGKDLTLIQGGGGNTSIKEEDEMWVKASGKWLSDAETENIFVSVNDVAIRKAVKANEVDPVTQYIDKNQTLRPSIETTLHALLQHKVVLHVHSVNAIAWSVRKDGFKQLKVKLQGLNWSWLDYHQPGVPLTNAVSKIIKNNPDLLILANHGLVVGADNCKNAEKLLYEIETRLSCDSLNVSPKPNIEKLTKLSENIPYKLASSDEIHAIATDINKLKVASQGIFYPDHVVFLGAELCIVNYGHQVAPSVENYYKKYSTIPIAIYIENAGVLVSNDIGLASEVMLLALSYVLMRLDLSVECNYLKDDQIFQLLNWEAEKYRQEVTRKLK
jgi:rhamnose utilization protein RhaD (predicted bifunctional aldolase and dehydrogenase)